MKERKKKKMLTLKKPRHPVMQVMQQTFVFFGAKFQLFLISVFPAVSEKVMFP